VASRAGACKAAPHRFATLRHRRSGLAA
jgi:hypothetical protein